jgi:hypothetical protein
VVVGSERAQRLLKPPLRQAFGFELLLRSPDLNAKRFTAPQFAAAAANQAAPPFKQVGQILARRSMIVLGSRRSSLAALLDSI